MGWKLLLLFFAVAAAFDEDIPDSYNPECMEQIYQNCDLVLVETGMEFPKTKEELQEACKIIQDYTDCATDILDKCKASEDIAKPLYTARDVFRNICDESSNLFPVIEENLKCLADNLEYFEQPCPLTPDQAQDLNDIVNAFSAADEEAFQNSDICMASLSRIGCMASKLKKKCGDDTVDVLLQILDQVEKPFERCGPGVKENLSLIAGIIEVEEDLAEDLEEMKKKKR